jgi:hypothetical protein
MLPFSAPVHPVLEPVHERLPGSLDDVLTNPDGTTRRHYNTCQLFCACSTFLLSADSPKVGLCFQRANSQTGKLRRFPRDGQFTTYSKGL